MKITKGDIGGQAWELLASVVFSRASQQLCGPTARALESVSPPAAAPNTRGQCGSSFPPLHTIHPSPVRLRTKPADSSVSCISGT